MVYIHFLIYHHLLVYESNSDDEDDVHVPAINGR